MSNIRDRGSKKWTSIMLTEHVEMLKDYFDDEYYQVEKPVLDDQKMEEWNEIIGEAMEFHKKLHITHYERGHRVSITGYIHHIDPIQKILHIKESEEDKTLYLLMEDVLNIETSK